MYLILELFLNGRGMGLLFEGKTYRVIGAAMRVHGELGAGFVESVYQEALGRAFAAAGIPFEAQRRLRVLYEGILVEIKAVTAMPLNFIRQVLHYLKATGYRIGLFINFGAPGLQWKRVIV